MQRSDGCHGFVTFLHTPIFPSEAARASLLAGREEIQQQVMLLVG
jgi:hypothetical protein